MAAHLSAVSVGRHRSRVHPAGGPRGTAIHSSSAAALRFLLVPSLEEEDIASRWTETEDRLEITVSTEGVDPHDVALELLVCLGQALWKRATSAERTGWLQILGAELDAGVTGEIDEDGLRAKRELLSSRVAARSMRRLQRYAGVSFASTAVCKARTMREQAVA